MASTTVKARRVTEPTVQRHPYPLDDDRPLTELASAWDNITEAKSALYRAEARLEQSESSPAMREQRPTSLGSLLKQRHPPGSRLPVDSVPSLEIRSNPNTKVNIDQKNRGNPVEKSRKRVTIREDASLTSVSDLPSESSSRDILGNGPANFSAGSSSEIRVLNDISTPSMMRQTSTVEVSPGLRVSKDYIPAYDRLFGDKPVLKLSKDSVGQSFPDTPENRKLLSMISSSSRHHDPSTLSHMERLRDRIQQQKLSASRVSDLTFDSQRRIHKESDPVTVSSENEANFVLGSHVAPKVPVRKVASAPPAPTYRGFNQAETRFQIPDGRIITEEQVKRKTSRQSVRHNHARSSEPSATTKPLQPSQRQTQENLINSKGVSSRASQRPIRKVRKAPLPNAKPKRPEPAEGVGVRSWREGQKTVLKMLGPPPKQPTHSAPAKEVVLDSVQNSHALSDPGSARTEDDVDRLSEHPIESDNEGDVQHRPESPPLSAGRLPEEAQGVLNDLHLDDTDDEKEACQSLPGSKSNKVNNNVPRLSQKKKAARLKNNEVNSSSGPVQKVRHYEAEQVQRYMAKQRADRRKKMQDEKKQRAMQAEKKKEQLQDLFKRQRESAKASQRVDGAVGAAVTDDQRLLDQTFSKGPGTSQQHPMARPVSLARQHPFPDNHRRIDVTGSDKENRAFWSTSSSDSSLRSSPQTDLSASTPQDPQPGMVVVDPHHFPHDGPSGRDIILEPVREEELPAATPAAAAVVAAAASLVIRNQLNEGDARGNKNGPISVTPSIGTGASHIQPATARPRPATSPGKPRTKADRLAAIKANAAALQGRLENEVRQLTGDLTNLAASAIQGQGNGSPRSPTTERWAYPLSGSVPSAQVSSTPSPSARPGVRFSVPDPTALAGYSPAKLTKHQRVAGTNQDFSVFVGSLPGVSNLAQQAWESEETHSKSHAATTIQAAFRGHQVRQKLNWELPSGDTLKDRLRGKEAEAPVPQIRLSGAARRQSPRGSFSHQEHGLQSDGESLSEGPLSEESSGAEVDQEYTPKFKSLPTRAQARLHHPTDNRQTNINFSQHYAAQDPQRDGLSVIDIYMRRYQESQRELQARHRSTPHTQPDRTPISPRSYSEDFTGGSQPSSARSLILDSPSFSRTKHSPIPTSASADNISEISSNKARSSKESNASRPPTGRSLSLPSPGRDTSMSPADTSHSLSASEKKRSRTPSPRPVSLRDAGTQTPPSSRSSPSSIKSRSSSSRGSHSPASESRSPVSDHKSPVDEIRSLIEDLKKSTCNADSAHGDGARSGASPTSRTLQGHQDTRNSPPGRTHAESPTSPHSSSFGMMPGLPGAGRNAKSPVTREVLSHFKPISRPGSEMSGRSPGTDPSMSSSSVLTSAVSQPGPNKHFSPSALQLKMAAELNLLETLEESVRQLSEVERSRAVALAQQESSSLAKILQARQRDHEKELQLLSAKARQEVEAANRQLADVRQKAARTALEAEQVLVQARSEVATDTRDSTHRLVQTQAEAARVTAEAAKQLAEAHKVSVSKPPPPPPPQLDAAQVAADSAKAATAAAVTAAMEQQRLQHRDMLEDMRAAQHPPPPVMRSVAAGNSRADSSYATTPSRSLESKTPSAHYTEDFTNTASMSSHSPSTATRSSVDNIASERIPTASDSSFLSKRSESSKSIRTASSIPYDQPHSPGRDQSDSIATASDLVSDRDQSRSAATPSSIRTESGAKGSSTTKESITEEMDNTKSSADQYSISFERSDSDSSVPSVVSPTPTKPEGKRDSKGVARRGVVLMTPGGAPRDKTELLSDTMQTEKETSFSSMTIEMIQKQLKDEEARSQQQVTLLKLREKVLVDKTNAELEWLEHQKRRLKEKDDQEGVASLRKRQRALLAKLQTEQGEIKRLLITQKQSTLERQRLLKQQHEIARMRKVTARYKDQMRDLPAISPTGSSVIHSPSDGDVDGLDGGDDSMASRVGGSGDSVSDSSSLLPGSPSGLDGEVSPSSTTAMLDRSAMEKQAKVMQRLKMMEQPLSMKLLMKREMKLKKRRKNAQELLKWKQRLDKDEEEVVHMEHEVLHLFDGTKRKTKTSGSKDRPKTAAEAKGRDADGFSSPGSLVSPNRDALSEGEISEEYSYKSDSFNSTSKSEAPSVVSKTKSESHRSGAKSATPNSKLGSSSGTSVAEEIQNSSISEEIASTEKTQSGKSVSESPHTVADMSSDDTIKEASAIQGYGSDSFDSSAADQTLTPSKPSARLAVGAEASPSSPLAQARTLSSSTPKSLSSSGTTTPSRRSAFMPHHQRSRHPSDSGSESEKSFSQTMSETASDHSDIEGRVRALKDALKRRKMEADRLRKQQKRLSREKLKAQEASLKKQLETYDSIIATTKAELEQESKKQKLQTGQLLAPSAKPQIKQPKAGHTESSVSSMRQARALRQRTASDSSQDGVTSDARSASAASVRGRSGSESGRSSRSSLEGGGGYGLGGVLGEERVASGLASSRDRSYSSFSATSSPSTHHSEGGASPKSPRSESRDRSISAGSSIAEDISIRSDYSDREGTHDSEKFDSEDHQKIKEKLQRIEGDKESDRVSVSPLVGGRRSGDGRDADETGPGPNQVALSASPVLSNRHATLPGAERDDDLIDRDVSISSSVPEEIISAASLRTQDSFEDSKSAIIVSNLPKSDHELSYDDDESLHLSSSAHTAVSSPSGDRASVNQLLDDASQRSMKSVSSSVHSRSSSRVSSRPQSAKSESSYTNDFVESSVVSKEQESKSDTDEDISEHLSEMSFEKSSHSQHSGQVVFDLKERHDEQETRDLDEDLPEVTVTPRAVVDVEKEDHLKDTTLPEPTEDKALDFLEKQEPEVEIPGDFQVGDRVVIGGTQPGTLRFIGHTQFATGLWAGIELDEAVGTNDGTLHNVSYFTCKPTFGIFAPYDRVVRLPTDFKPVQALTVSLEDDYVSDQSSIEEDLPSESSVRSVTESDLVKSRSAGKNAPQEFREGDLEEDKESERSLSQLTSIKSEENLGEATEDEASVGGIDDDALEKLISNVAEAVESFSHDEPGFLPIDPAQETPRGAPEDESLEIEALPQEDKEEERLEAENRMVDSITDNLTEVVIKDTFDDMLEEAGNQKEEEVEQEKSKDSLLKLLVTAESPRSDIDLSEVPIEKSESEIPEKENKEVVEKQAESVAKSLMNEAIVELLKLRKHKNEKLAKANENRKKAQDDKPASDLKTPEDSLSPELRAETPYTPDKSPERRIDTIAALDDDIFINRVHVESSLGNDNIPVARPGSPVFGESGSVSPEALNEKLEQLQLDKDILEADLFGDQEWFDDEFGSMKKSQSIIQVPERLSAKTKTEPSAGKTAQEAVPAKKNAKLDLKKIVEEPYYAVPHSVKEVKDLASKSVEVFHEKVLNKEPTTPDIPADILGPDSKGSDIESSSRRAYKNLMFTLSGEVYQAINREQEPTTQPPWMKPKRKPRRYFFQQPPRDKTEMTNAVGNRVLSLTGLVKKPKQETPLAGSKLSKKKDHVDEILIDELKEEEPEWIDYDNDELSVKSQLADALFESLLVDTAMMLHQIEDKRKARRERHRDDHFGHHDVEF